jgi:signal transduction histidine kinase
MTGIGDEQLALEAVEQGAQDYLVKGDIDGRLLVRALDYSVVRKRADDAERQMLEAQRLEGLALLAVGVAHQLNNLLVVIMGNASLAGADLPADHPARECLQQIEVASERAARLAQQMLAYSGRGGFVVRPLDLNDVVRSACEALERELPHGVRVRVGAFERPLVIDGDESQVAQLVLSLVVNAAEATQSRPGLVTVRTSTCDMSAEDVARAAGRWDLPPGPCARLEVIDTGTGMTADVLARVFEPFYSTRLTGRGLGLPAALGVVRGHRGILTIDSTPGTGTAVGVLLPLRRDE